MLAPDFRKALGPKTGRAVLDRDYLELTSLSSRHSGFLGCRPEASPYPDPDGQYRHTCLSFSMQSLRCQALRLTWRLSMRTSNGHDQAARSHLILGQGRSSVCIPAPP